MSRTQVSSIPFKNIQNMAYGAILVSLAILLTTIIQSFKSNLNTQIQSTVNHNQYTNPFHNVNENVKPIKDKISNKKIAFIGNIVSFRLGGAEFIDVITNMFAKPLVPNNDTYINNNNYPYFIDSSDIISYGESGKLFLKQWCSCNYFLGWINEWKIDIILWNNGYSLKYYSFLKEFIADYDVLFFYSERGAVRFPRLKEINRKQYRFLIDVEPQHAVQHQHDFKDNITEFNKSYKKRDFYPIIVDVSGLTTHDMNYANSTYHWMWQGIHSLPSITWRYRYPMKWMLNIINNNLCDDNDKYLNKTLVFLSRRCHKKNDIREYIQNNYNNSWIIWDHNENPKTNIEFIPFYCKLSSTKYVFHFENYISAGQIIGESAVYGVPTFGYSTKYMESLLMPRFMFVNPFDLKELFEKMNFLESHPFLYKKIQIDIKRRAKELFIDSTYSINDFIDDVHETLNSKL